MITQPRQHDAHPVASPDSLYTPVRMSFDDLGLSPAVLRAVAEEGYTEPTPDPAPGHPDRAVRPGPHGASPDRHRQDGGLCPAHPRAHEGAREHLVLAGAAPRARPGRGTHAGAGHPGPRQLPRLRSSRRIAFHDRLRRRPHVAAGARPSRWRRDRRGDAGSTARSRWQSHDQPRPGRGARAR